MSDLTRLKRPIQEASQEAERAFLGATEEQESTLLKIVELMGRVEQYYEFLVRTTKNEVAPISRDRGDIAVKGSGATGAIRGQKAIRLGVER